VRRDDLEADDEQGGHHDDIEERVALDLVFRNWVPIRTAAQMLPSLARDA
jgi:hypothetical protein